MANVLIVLSILIEIFEYIDAGDSCEYETATILQGSNSWLQAVDFQAIINVSRAYDQYLQYY